MNNDFSELNKILIGSLVCEIAELSAVLIFGGWLISKIFIG